MLYIVSTPIGSVEEISMQALKILLNSDVILAEDTRSFDRLYKSAQKLYGLVTDKKQQIISYYKDNEFEKLPEVISLLEQDKIVSLVSEAGTPLISDPGSLLVQACMRKGLSYSAIPGSVAFVNAAILAGKSFDQLMFLGFLPRKQSDQNRLFRNIEKVAMEFPGCLFSFYASPMRIYDTAALILSDYPDFDITIVREMNKMYEEVLPVTAENVEELKKIKGEITVVMKKRHNR